MSSQIKSERCFVTALYSISIPRSYLFLKDKDEFSIRQAFLSRCSFNPSILRYFYTHYIFNFQATMSEPIPEEYTLAQQEKEDTDASLIGTCRMYEKVCF